MISMPARWSAAVRCALVLLLILGASSCGKTPQARRTKQINCDSDVDVDATTGVSKQVVYVCDGDKFTWKAHGHHFVIVFAAGSSPFTEGANFDDNHPTGTAQPQYTGLTVYKYSITVDSGKPFDPQVVTGGNP